MRCAHTEDDKGRLCWNFRDAPTGSEVNGWVCTKTGDDTETGMSSVWYPPELAFTSDPYDRLVAIYRRAEAQEGEIALPLPDDNTQARTITVDIDDRHQRHTELLPQLADRFPVTDEHAQAMAKRLYRDDHARIRDRMQQLGYFSCTKPNQRMKLDQPIPGAVACADGGWELRIQKGLYCPMRDEVNRILGWEFRNDTKRGPKYHPLSKQADRESRNDCCSIQLPDSSEQPITFNLPFEWSQATPDGGYHTLILVEGKGIKPQVVAWMACTPVIGCGGSLAGGRSPEQLLRYCSRLNQGGRLVLFADAGWLLNPNVALATAETVGVLEQAGYMPVIASARPWKKQGDKKQDKHHDPDGTVYFGSDPDEFAGPEWWSVVNAAKSLAEWVADEQTPEEVKVSITKGLAKVIKTSETESHIRRQSSANRRKTHNIVPKLLTTTASVTHFEPGKQIEATLNAMTELRDDYLDHRAEWVRENIHHFYAKLEETKTPVFADPESLLLDWTQIWCWAIHFDQDPSAVIQEHGPENFTELERKIEKNWSHSEMMGTFDEYIDGVHRKTLKHLRHAYPYKKPLAIIFNTSGTGSGKSREIGHRPSAEKIRTEGCNKRQGAVIYVNKNYRSPSCHGIGETYNEVEARHGGLIKVATPGGGFRWVRADAGTPAHILDAPPSCARAFEFAHLVNRGHNQKAIQKYCSGLCPLRPEKWVSEVQEDGTEIMVNRGGDNSCKWAHKMRQLVQNVVQPKSTRSEDVHFLRTSTDGLAGLASYGSAYIERAVIVIDETDQLNDAVSQTIRISHDDLMAMQRSLPSLFRREIDQEVRELARDLLQALDRLLDPPADLKPNQFDYGMGVTECRKHPAVQQAVQAIAQFFRQEDGSVKPWIFGSTLTADSRVRRQLTNALTDENKEKRAQRIEEVPMVLLYDLLRAVMPENTDATGQSIIVDSDGKSRVLRLRRRRSEFSEALQSAKAVIVLDASERPEDTLAQLGFRDEVVHSRVIEQETVRTGAQMKVQQVPCLFGMGRNRSAQATSKRDQLVDAWFKRQVDRDGRQLPDSLIGVIDHMPFCRKDHSQEQGWMTINARGGNQFEDVNAFAGIGLPLMNMNALEQQVELVMGPGSSDRSSEAFRHWQSHRVAVDLLQFLGRPRAGRRPATDIINILLVSDADLSIFFRQLGWPVPQVVRWEEVTGHPLKVRRPEEAHNKVAELLRKKHESGLWLPMQQGDACKQANTCERAFKRSVKAGRPNYLKLRTSILGIGHSN